VGNGSLLNHPDFWQPEAIGKGYIPDINGRYRVILKSGFFLYTPGKKDNDQYIKEVSHIAKWIIIIIIVNIKVFMTFV
jgi:hypothetical protein